MADGQTRPRLFDGEALTLAVLVFIAAILFGLPLFLLLKTGLSGDAGWSLTPVFEAFQSRSVLRALWNSLESSFLSALLALFIGALLALIVGLTDVRWKAVTVFLILLPMMIPPHVTAIAWIQALGPSSPVLRWLGLAPELGSTHPIYSREGLVFLLAVQHSPLVFLVVRAGLRGLPRDLFDAARVSGAGTLTLGHRILLPLLLPSLVAGFALAFVSALGNFGITALIGIPARYTTLPVLIWRRLASFGPDVLGDVAVLAVIVAIVAIFAVTMQILWQNRTRLGLVGQSGRPLEIALGRWQPAMEILLGLVIAVTLVLPLSSLIATSLVKTYGLPLALETFTLDNFAEILFRQSVTVRAFVNSTLIAGCAAALLAFFAILIGYYMQKRGRSRWLAGGVAGMGDIAYAIPGLVISIGFILAFIRPLPLIDRSLYGTSGIILIAYLCAFFAIALKPVGAAYAQLDRSLDDAARVSGARFYLRIRSVFFPLILPAAASGAILVFLTAYNEVTVSALLWSTGNETIGTTIFNYEDGGYTTLASAMASLTVLATIVLMLGLNLASGRLPAGVIPWRND